MREYSYKIGTESIKVHAVDDLDDVEVFQDWRLSVQNKGPIGIDSEATGLQTYGKDRLRMVQFGTATESWVIPVEQNHSYIPAIKKALLEIPLGVLHNASFDLQVFERHLDVPMEKMWPRVLDTRILAHLIDPRGPEEGGTGHGLEQLVKKYISPVVADEVKGLMTKLAREHKTTKSLIWDSIDLNHPDYNLYAGMDPILAVRLFQELIQLVPQESKLLIRYEHEIAEVCSYMERNGFLLDREYSENLSEKLADEEKEASWHAAAFFEVESVNSTAQVADALEELDYNITGRTPTGKRKVDNALLNSLLVDNPVVGSKEHLAVAVSEAKKARKWRTTWVDGFLRGADSEDRVHASINPLRARTARMCLPYSESLVTRRGTLPISAVEIGDETLDAKGDWVLVEQIHHFSSSPVTSYRANPRGKPGRYVLRSTADHRWVQKSSKGNITVRPITGSGTKVVLAPQTGFNPLAPEGFLVATEEERIASLVALLVTDGRLAAGYTKGVGISALLYQVERKYYKEILNLIDSVSLNLKSYDRITNDQDHHEIGLRVRELRKILPAELFPVQGTLKQSPALLQWVNQLSVAASAAFLRACYLADGSSATAHRVISAQPSCARDAMRIAGYRSGWLSTVQTSNSSGWGTKRKEFLSFRTSKYSMTELTSEITGYEPVWCITTSTGTFTAEGEIGMYLTGNSISGIPAQTLPSGDWIIRRCFLSDPGHVISSVDFDSQEMRVLAALSQDEAMLEVFRGDGQIHLATARSIFGSQVIKGSSEYKTGKMAGFLRVFGGGKTKLALQAGITEELAGEVLAGFNAAYQGVFKYTKEVQRVARDAGHVVTPFGRVLPVDEDRSYAALNYMVQSTARDLTCQGLIRLHRAGLTSYLRLPIHDEILSSLPEKDAVGMSDIIAKLMTRDFKGVNISASGELGKKSWGSLYGSEY